MRKIGMIFECTQVGADIKVCTYLAERLSSDIEVISVPLTNKPTMISRCGATVSVLLQSCQSVIIIWDLNPPWDENRVLCRKKDCDAIQKSLLDAGLTNQQLHKVHLVCIEQELEAWLLADSRAIASFLHNVTNRECRVNSVKQPEHERNPKKHLNRILQQHTGRPYIDREHAEKIIRELPDFKKISRCKSFVRFKTKILGDVT